MLPRPMTMLHDAAPALMLAKIFGAVAGSLVSLAYILPRNRREAALRFTVGTVCGFALGIPAGLKAADALGILDRLTIVEVSLMGSMLASLCAWWGLGVLHRMSEWLPFYFETIFQRGKPTQSKKDQ
ncbi:DUF6107 family protein [Pseudahrensia aquimaris]|uniref:DUF6107 family protein n=1 Tax=Pseudahrensia aquimaris TaxID=744461 RepID=A0ABW3FBN5_9HYPH